MFPRGTNYVVKSAVARVGWRKLPVSIFNHQGWAVVRMTSPKTQEVKWEVQFAPADSYRFPPSEPSGLWLERVGLDGVNLHWRSNIISTRVIRFISTASASVTRLKPVFPSAAWTRTPITPPA